MLSNLQELCFLFCRTTWLLQCLKCGISLLNESLVVQLALSSIFFIKQDAKEDFDCGRDGKLSSLELLDTPTGLVLK